MAFRSQLFVYAFIFLGILSCGEYRENFLEYRADFNPQKIEIAEKTIVHFADKNKLRVFSKDKEKMSTLSGGKKAFYIALYFKDDPILLITNVGASVQLSLSSVDYGNMTESDLKALTIALVEALQLELNIKFEES
ncbi:MAG: hypothetical protein KKH70_01140 [Gammaproteobacteria bacterium]|nr:hypothetical protein [Gammaproteobacteria bacterium]